MIRAGELRCRVTIEQSVEGEPSATGAREPTYTEWGKAWADVRTVGGREIERARTISATVSHTAKIRYRADIPTTGRLRWGSRVFSINAVVDPDNRRREQTIYCTEELSA